MAQPTPSLYALDPSLPVLLRPDGAVQVGCSPGRAVLIRPPRGLKAAGLATLLRAMQSPVPMSELQRQSGGLSAGELDDLVAQLVKAGVATHGRRQRPARSASIRVHGRPCGLKSRTTAATVGKPPSIPVPRTKNHSS
jgi:hypothetical protein